MRGIIGPLGVFTGIFFTAAVLNFFVKLINKKYISKLPKEKAAFTNGYRKVMKIIVKYHKWFGIAAFVVLGTHFVIAYSMNWVKLTGTVSAVIMLMVVLLGVYGFYFNKNFKAPWLKVHRVLGLALIATIIIHALS